MALTGDSLTEEEEQAILDEEPSRLEQEAQEMVVEVLYRPPGNHNQDPGTDPITYALLRLNRQLSLQLTPPWTVQQQRRRWLAKAGWLQCPMSEERRG